MAKLKTTNATPNSPRVRRYTQLMAAVLYNCHFRGFADGKIYKGDSTKPEDCVLTFTGKFNASRLLFMAIELSELKK